MQRYVIQPEIINGKETGYRIPVGLGTFYIATRAHGEDSETVRRIMAWHYPEATEIYPNGEPRTAAEPDTA